MNRYRYLAFPAYLVALVLILVPFFDTTMQLYPLNPGNAQWRFGAIGLFSNAFMIPAAGMLIALVTALTLGHRGFLRVLGWLCAVGAFTSIVLLLLFGLDAFQTRLNVSPEARISFVVASFTAAVKLIFAAVTMTALARAGIKTKFDQRMTPRPLYDPKVASSLQGAETR